MTGTVFGRSMVLVGGRGLGDVMQLLLYVFVVRKFSEAEIGHYSFAFALALFLGLFVSMGARSLITREVRNDPTLGARFPVNLLFLHGVLTVLAGSVLVAWCFFAGIPVEVTVLSVLASLTTSLMAAGYSAIAIVDASGNVQRGAQGEIAAKTIAVLIGFGMLIADFPLSAIVGSQIVGAAVYVLLAYRWAQHAYGPIQWNPDWVLIGRVVKMAPPFLAAGLLYALYARIDIVMLHRMAGPEPTGHFAVAFRFVETSLIIATMVGIAMFPELATKQAGEQRRELFSGAVRWLAVLGGGISLLLIVAGDQLATLVFGANYAIAGELLMAMALLITIGYVKEPFWRLLIAQDREYLQLAIQGFAVCLNVVLNIILIPRFGAFGAVGASLISESLMLAGFGAVVVRLRWVAWGRVWAWVGVMALAVGSGFALRSYTWPIAAAIAAAGVLIAGFLLTRLVTMGEISMHLSRLGRRERDVGSTA